jgi:uncharacterized protein (TIGR02246 family)
MQLVLLKSSGYCFGQTKEKPLQDIIAKQEADWNKNDMIAFANSFTEDGTLINFLGFYWKGKDEIISQFKKINECCIKPTHIKLEYLDSKFLSDNAAVVHVKETLTAKDDYMVPGAKVKKGSMDHKYITAVFIKQENNWKIISMQVTQVKPLPQ